MTYEEFLDKINEAGVYISDRAPSSGWRDTGKIKCIVDKVESGGYSGGNCWGDSPSQYYSTGESLGRFEDLSIAVRTTSPSISFLDYEGVLDMVSHDTYTENEYYGNSTNYEYQYIETKKLYSYLKGLGHWGS